MASSSRENGSRGSWEIKNDSKYSPNGQTREKLTLHVKKRQSVDSRIKHESPSSELTLAAKKSKKTKKGGKARGGGKSSTPTRKQLKEESTGSEGATGETPDPEDSTSPNQVDEAALQQVRQEFINNVILKEILNEKKKVRLIEKNNRNIWQISQIQFF